MIEQNLMADWGRNLHREFRPFKICERPLQEQSVYVLHLVLEDGSQDIPMMGEQPRYSVAVDETIARSIRELEFGMPFDRVRLAEEAGIDASEIEVALLLKDFKTRNVLPIARWSLSVVPDRFEISSEDLCQISLVDDFEVSVVAYLKATRVPSPGIASAKGATLARCDLTVSIEGETGPDFQVTSISPDELEKLGYGRNALFIVEIEDEDYSKPAKEVFSVKVNEIAAEKLSQVQGTNTFGSAFYRHMMADILFQVSQKVFSSGIDPNWSENSVGKTLMRFIEKNANVPSEKLPQYANNEIDRLQAILQSSLEMASVVQRATLTGKN